MYRLKYIALILIPLIIFVIAASDGSDEIGKVTFPLGAVKINHGVSDEWSVAKLNSKVFSKDRIKTGAESRCEVTLIDGSIMRIGEKSDMSFENIKIKDKRLSGSAKLTVGAVWSNLQKLQKSDKAVSIKTPTSVMAVRGTIFRTDAKDDSSTSVLVYQGALDVKLNQEMEEKVKSQEVRKPGPPQRTSGPKQIPGPYEVTLQEWQRIVAGMQINVRKDGKYHSFEFDPAKDAASDWVKWNKERDSAVGK